VRVAVTLFAFIGTSFYSQGQAQNEAPHAARSRADETLAMWNSVGNKLIAMARDFPEDKYDFKLQKDQRTFAQTLLHVAGVNYLLMGTVSGSNIGPDLGKDVGNPSRETKAGVVNLLQQVVAGLDRTTKFPFGPQFLLLDVRRRAQWRALGPTGGLLSRRQDGSPAIATAIRFLKVFDWDS